MNNHIKDPAPNHAPETPAKKESNHVLVAILAAVNAVLVLAVIGLVIIAVIRNKNAGPEYEPIPKATEERTRRPRESETEAPTTQAPTTQNTPAETTKTEAPFINVLPSGDYNEYRLKEVKDAKGGWYCTFQAYSQYVFTDKDVNGLKAGDAFYIPGYDYIVQKKEQNRVYLIQRGADDSDLYLLRNDRGDWLTVTNYDGDPLTYFIGEFELFVTSNATFINDTVRNNTRVSSPHELWFYNEYTKTYNTSFPIDVDIRIADGDVTLIMSLFHP